MSENKSKKGQLRERKTQLRERKAQLRERKTQLRERKARRSFPAIKWIARSLKKNLAFTRAFQISNVSQLTE